MNPWLVIFLIALGLVCCIMAFYVVLSHIVVFVAKRHVEKTFRQYTEKVEQVLPGKNCGKCGCATCHAYAEKIVREGENDVTLCTEGSEEMADQLRGYIRELELLAQPEETPNPDEREQVEM